MALSIVGVNSAINNTGSNQTPSVALPSGTQNGDLVIAAFAYAGVYDATVAAGWSEIEDIPMANNGHLFIAQRVITPGVTSVSWTLDGAPPYAKIRLGVITLRGAGAVIPGTPYARSSSGTNTVVPGITTTAANSLVVGIFADRVSNQTMVTVPSGMTEQLKTFNSENGGVSLAIATMLMETAGATGDQTATYGVASINGAGILLEVTEAAGSPPVVDAGANKSVSAGATVQLTASSSGDTHAWTLVSGPTSVSISNSTTLNASVTLTVGGVYVFRCTSTNASGTGYDDVTVYVRDTVSVPYGVVNNPGNYTAVGAGTIEDALSDESDSTYIESEDNADGDLITVYLNPLEPGTPTVKVRAKTSTVPYYDVKVELLQGNTVIATETFETTGTFEDHTFVLDSNQIALLTNTDDLRARVTALDS